MNKLFIHDLEDKFNMLEVRHICDVFSLRGSCYSVRKGGILFSVVGFG